MTVATYNPNRFIHAHVRIYTPSGFYNTIINYHPYTTLTEAIREQMGEGTVFSPIDEFNNVKKLTKT